MDDHAYVGVVFFFFESQPISPNIGVDGFFSNLAIVMLAFEKVFGE